MMGIMEDMLGGREVGELNIHQTQSFIRYIEKLINAGLPIEEELKLHALKLQLTKRLLELANEKIKKGRNV